MRREPSLRPENLLAKALDDIERLKEWKSRVGDGRGLVITSGTGSGSTTPPVEAGEHVLYGSKHTNALRVTDGGGLVVAFESGQVVLVTNQVQFFSVPAGTLTLADNATNYVFVNSTGIVTSNTTGFPEDSVMLAEVVTSGGDIVSINDRRAYLHSHHVRVHDIDGSDHTGTMDIGDPQFPAPPAGYPADVAQTNADGVSVRVARADHVHAHGSGYLPDAHHAQVHGSADHQPESDAEAIHDNVAGEIAALQEKLTPAVSDLLLIEDSADANSKKKIQIGNLPTSGGGPHAIDGSSHTGTLEIGDPQLPAPSTGYPADVAATKADGTSAQVARADHVHAHGSGYLPDAHHSQTHDDSDHTGPSRVEVQDEGTVVATRAILNFVGDGVSVSDDSVNGRVNINIPGAAGTGHQIQEDGVALPQRSSLNFASGIVASDNQAADRTDVNIDYGVTADVSNADASVSSAGSLSRVARADHKHGVSVAAPTDLGNANVEGSVDALSRADHVHKRSVRVKSGTSDLIRNALNITGLDVADDAVNDEIDVVHDTSSPGHHAQVHDIDSADHTGTLDVGDVQLPAPPTGYPADIAAAKSDGTSPRVARADHVHAHGSGYLPDAHHSQAHDDSDHTGPSRVVVQDEGVTVATRTTLNFVGDGVTVSDDTANDRINISIPGGGTEGHQIQEDGTALPQRAVLNFGQGVVATDDSVNSRTNVDLDYATNVSVVEVATSDPGSSLMVSRGDHKHGVNVGAPVDLADSNQAGSASALARSDHVHKRSVRVKSGSLDFARNAVDISGLGVADDSVNDEIDIVHDDSSPGHHTQVHAIDSADHTGTLDIGDVQLPAPPAGYSADVAASKSDGTSVRVARADHVHAHGTGYLPDAHHPQAHGDDDHTGPSRVEVQDEGTTVGTRTVLNFTGAGVSVSDDPTNGRINIDIPGGGGGTGGHQIQEDGTALPQRTGLNFAAGLVASDNQASDRIDVDLDYGVTTDVSNVGANTNNKSAGSSSRVARADHVHVASTTVAVDLGDANAAGSSSFLSRSDHVHRRSVRVKSGSTNIVRNALNITGLSVVDDATNNEIDITHDASSSGHHAQVHDAGDHSGVIGKVYTTLLWYIDGTVATGDGQGATPYLEDTVDQIRLRAAVDTAPVGQGLIAEVNHSTDRVTWSVVGTVTIADGSTTGETTLASGTLQPGWYRLDINQVGSTTAGSDLTVMFVCKRPVMAS